MPSVMQLLTRSMIVLPLVIVAGVSAADREAVPDDRELSAGVWNVAAAEWEGNPVDPEWLARLRVLYRPDGSWTVFLRRAVVAEGRSTHRQDVTPKTFEMETLGSEGIPPSRYSGIYRLEGDTRTLCIVRAGTARPDEFAAPRRSGRMLVILKRAQNSLDESAHTIGQ